MAHQERGHSLINVWKCRIAIPCTEALECLCPVENAEQQTANQSASMHNPSGPTPLYLVLTDDAVSKRDITSGGEDPAQCIAVSKVCRRVRS
jgi:hypothetical protein